MTRARNLSFLLFLLAVLYASPAIASPCGSFPSQCGCDYNGNVASVYCDFSPYSCAESYPFFCSDVSYFCEMDCGPGNYYTFCTGDGFPCTATCVCG
jgi:hypothetical protein